MTDSNLSTKNVGEYPKSSEANYVLGILFIAYTFSFIDRQVLGVLIGPIKEDLQITDFEFSLLQGVAFALLYAVMALPFGRMADTKSRKTIMSLGVFFWSLMTIGCGVAKNFTQLFVMRMGVGVGEAALSPAAYSTITDSFPRKKLTRSMAIYKAGTVFGSGLALVLGGKFYEYYSTIENLSIPLIGTIVPWQATFITFGLPGILIAFLIFLTNEPTRKGLLKTSNVTSKSLSIKEVAQYMFVEHRQLYASIFGGCAVLGIVTAGYSAWFTEMLIRDFSLTRGQAGAWSGYVYIGAGLAGVLSGPLFVAFFEKRGHKNAAMRALLLFALCTIPAAVVAPQMPTHTFALAFMAIVVFFQGAYLGVSAAAVQMVSPNQMRGQAAAFYLFFVSILAMALGSSFIAGLTDFVFEEESALHDSISLASAILVPIAAFLFWKGLQPFTRAIEASEEWS